MNLYTTKQVIEMIRKEIARLGGHQKSLCEVADVKPSYLSDILKGKRNPNPGLLEYLGLQMEIRYTEKDETP